MAKQQCPKCKGSGKVNFIHNWSDGPGWVEGTCPLCDGVGEVGDLAKMALEYKQQAGKAQTELASLRQNVYLYLKCEEEGGVTLHPADRPKGAPGPSPYSSTWLKYLKDAASKVPLIGEAGKEDKSWWDRQIMWREKDLAEKEGV